jgi:hypothetical protein
LLGLIRGINRTNAKAAFNDKQTISDAIAERDVTGKQRDFLSTVAEVASTRQDRYSKSEVKFLPNRVDCATSKAGGANWPNSSASWIPGSRN